jgi:hypothetical protein
MYLDRVNLILRNVGSADVVVSTTDHEFFGVSVIEAIYSGCYPICPNRLVFPEYLPEEHLYNTVPQVCSASNDNRELMSLIVGEKIEVLWQKYREEPTEDSMEESDQFRSI